MSFGPLDTIGASLKLPTLQSISSSVSGVVTSLETSATQLLSNFGSANSTTKQAEAIAKIASTGNAGDFTSVSRDINVTPQNGQLIATNATTGSGLAVLVNVPSGSPANIDYTDANDDNTIAMKVTLTAEPNLYDGVDPSIPSQIVFTAMPTISESHAATYESFQPLHHPGEILKYKGTNARSWKVDAKLISRTVDEADANLQIINIIRSWVMPFYGNGTNDNLSAYLGAPPVILTLTAYGDKMIGPAKCVLDSHSWTWPNDVDWIQTSDNTPFPVIISVSLDLKESWSPAEYSSFDLLAYRRGDLYSDTGAFSTNASIRKPSPQNATASTSGDTSQPQNATQSDVNSGNSSSSSNVSNVQVNPTRGGQ